MISITECQPEVNHVLLLCIIDVDHEEIYTTSSFYTALLGCQFAPAWVQRNSMFGSPYNRLFQTTEYILDGSTSFGGPYTICEYGCADGGPSEKVMKSAIGT